MAITQKQTRRLNREYRRSQRLLNSLGRRLLDQSIDLGTFEREFAVVLKESAIAAYLITTNGKPTAQHWGSSGGHLTQQYAYLHDFVTRIHNGDVTEKQFFNSIERYARSIDVAASRADKINNIARGRTQAKRLLDPQAKHCSPCIGHERRKYINASDITPRGVNCLCGERCRCRVIYKAPSTRATRKERDRLIQRGILQDRRNSQKTPSLEQIEKLFFGRS